MTLQTTVGAIALFVFYSVPSVAVETIDTWYSGQYRDDEITCNEDCAVICDKEEGCQRAVINCPPYGDCAITCSDTRSCSEATINCPIGYACDITCSADRSCAEATINAADASSLSINNCADGAFTCAGLTIYFPPNDNGAKRATIEGDDGLSEGSYAYDSVAEVPIQFYAINGWDDVDVINYSGAFMYHAGTMHCAADYGTSCAFDADAWACDLCNNPQTAAPTHSPTPAPSVYPSASPSGYPTTSPVYSCDYVPAECQGDLDWAVTTGSQTNPEFYPDFYEVTGVQLTAATVEDMTLFFVCTGETAAFDRCIDLQLPCSRSCPSPTGSPSVEPSASPSTEPSSSPSTDPSASPGANPTASPSANPTALPSANPTALPSAEPTASPITEPPSAEPSVSPSTDPSVSPSTPPTSEPSIMPSNLPSSNPTLEPTVQPSETHHDIELTADHRDDADETSPPTASPTTTELAQEQVELTGLGDPEQVDLEGTDDFADHLMNATESTLLLLMFGGIALLCIVASALLYKCAKMHKLRKEIRAVNVIQADSTALTMVSSNSANSPDSPESDRANRANTMSLGVSLVINPEAEDDEKAEMMTPDPDLPETPDGLQMTTPDGFQRDLNGVYVSANVVQQRQLSVISEAEHKRDDDGSDDDMYIDMEIQRRETPQGTPYQTPQGSPKGSRRTSALSLHLSGIDELDELDDDAMYIDMHMANETADGPGADTGESNY